MGEEMDNRQSFIFSVKGKIRRFLLPKFRPGYVRKQLLLRQGDCLQCGKCCKFLYHCPFLRQRGEEIYCLVYNVCRPQQCRIFPIDERDLLEVNGPCGYYFPNQDKPTGLSDHNSR